MFPPESRTCNPKMSALLYLVVVLINIFRCDSQPLTAAPNCGKNFTMDSVFDTPATTTAPGLSCQKCIETTCQANATQCTPPTSPNKVSCVSFMYETGQFVPFILKTCVEFGPEFKDACEYLQRCANPDRTVTDCTSCNTDNCNANSTLLVHKPNPQYRADGFCTLDDTA